MRRLSIPALIVLLFLGCSGSGGSDQQTTTTTTATAMDSRLTFDMDWFMPRVSGFEAVLVGIFNPGSPLKQKVVLTPLPSPPALPFSFTFIGPYDSNGDGIDEKTLNGRATFDSDPANAWSSVTGQAVVDVDIPVVHHIYHATVNFTITSDERRLFGSGTFMNALTGNTTTMTVAEATPLVVKPATGAASAMSNACGYSLNGQMLLEVTGSSGTLKSTWNFSSDSASVAVNNRTFTDPSGQTTTLPDSTVTLPCGGGTIKDWDGIYDQHWACLPLEFGQATIKIKTTGPTTVEISDQELPITDPPSTYPAATIGGNPHALRGFFISVPPVGGFRYREDFNWTMRTSLSAFAQFSKYVYIEGPNKDKGGYCIAYAPRVG